MSTNPKKSVELIKIAQKADYQARGEYGPFAHTPPSNPKNRRNFDYHSLKELSFPEIVKSAEEIRAKIYRNLLIHNTRTNAYALLTLPRRQATETITLLHAIKDYKKRCPPHDNPSHFIGACMSMPGEFARLCSNKYGINVETPHFGDVVSFFHEVALSGNIVIDWTVRQYPEYEDYPYPYIYRIGKDTFGGGVVKRDENNRDKLVTQHETSNS